MAKKKKTSDSLLKKDATISPLEWSYHLIPPELKDATWFSRLITANSPYMGVFYENTGWFGGYSRNELLRMYGEGTQPEEYYRQLFDPQKALAVDTQSEFNYINLDYKIISYIPTMLRRVFAKLDGLQVNFEAQAVDPIANDERRLAMEKLKAQPKIDRKLAGFSQQLKTEPIKSGLQKEALGKDNKTPTSELGDIQFDFENDDELQLYMSLYYKQGVEIAQELALKTVLNNQEIEEKKKRLIWDSLYYSKAAAQCYTSAYTGLPVVENIDLRELYVSYHRRKDYKDMNAWKKIKWVTMNELVEMIGGEAQPQDIREIFKYAVKTWGYPTEYGSTSYSYPYNDYSKINPLIFDRVKVPLAYYEIKSTDVLSYEEASSDKYSNRTKIRKMDADQKKKWDGTVNKYYAETVYTGYIINTMTWEDGNVRVYQFSKLANMTRERGKEQITRFSLHIYDYGEKSLVEQLRPHADEIQLAFLKAQLELVMARPSGWSWNVDAITDVVLGNGKITHKELFRMFFQTGSTFHRTMTEGGDNIMANSNSPHMRMENGLSKSFEGYTNTINFHKNMMEEIIGQTPTDITDPRVPAEGIRASQALSDDAMFFLVSGLKDIIENIGLHTSLMIQDIVNEGGKPMEALKAAIGQANIDVISTMGKLPLHQFGIKLEEKFTNEQKKQFEADISQAYQKGDVDFSDTLLARFCQNVKQAVALLNIKIKKRQQQAMKEKAQDQQAQSQLQQQVSQLKLMVQNLINQGDLQVEKQRGVNELSKENVKQHGQMLKEVQSHLNKLTQNHQQNNFDQDNIGLQSQLDNGSQQPAPAQGPPVPLPAQPPQPALQSQAA